LSWVLLEVAGVVALQQLLVGLAEGAVDHATTLDRRAFGNLSSPAHDVLVFMDL